MRSFLLLSLFTLLTMSTLARPSQMEERNESEAEETEYESNEDDTQSEDSAPEEDESRLSDQDTSDLSGEQETKSRLVKMDREKFYQRPAAGERENRANTDNFSEYARNSKEEKVDEAPQANNEFSIPKRRQSNRYIDNSDVIDPPENVHLTNYKTNRVQAESRANELNKRTIDARLSSFEDSDALFENNKENMNEGDKIEYNNEVVSNNEKPRHYKQYYNSMQSNQRNMFGDRNYEDANRNRRQAEQSEMTLVLSSSTSTEKGSFSSNNNEEDEAAIKRHIRKLSGDELEELLNTLSEDKRALLNKIMDSDSTYEAVNKREITKKAGAVEENGYIDNSLSEISKVQGSNSIDVNTAAAADSAASPGSDVETGKQPESQTESSDNTKTPDTTRSEITDNKSDLARHTDESNNSIKSESSLEPNSDSSNSEPTKTENKRETNLSYGKNQDGTFGDDTQSLDSYYSAKDSDDSFNDPSHVCSQDDDLAQLMDEEALLHDSNEHQYKREVAENQVDLDDSIKSLEESFPNSNIEENGQYFESNMAPLVRVKRKNENSIVKKRAAIDVPEAKVAYFPYKAENDDEDNEEGGEFDDDGFYDRTSNFAKNDANKPNEPVASKGFAARSPQLKVSKPQTNVEEENSKSDEASNEKIDSDTMSLGSDTDSVLSGVEGVDENLMFSSGTRNKRKAEDAEQLTEIEKDRPLRSTPLSEVAKPSDTFMNLQNYQENDAFGPLPRNEGELNRYKRIRRVKASQSPVTVAGK